MDGINLIDQENFNQAMESQPASIALLLYRNEQFNPEYLNVFNLAVSPMSWRDADKNTILSFDFYSGNLIFTSIEGQSTDIQHINELIKNSQSRFSSIDPVVFTHDSYVVFSAVYTESQGNPQQPNVLDFKSRRALFILNFAEGITSLKKIVDTIDAKITIEVLQEPYKLLKVTSSTGNSLVNIELQARPSNDVSSILPDRMEN